MDNTLNSQASLNLRNVFAHCLARPANCTVQNAGIAVILFSWLADAAGRIQTALKHTEK